MQSAVGNEIGNGDHEKLVLRCEIEDCGEKHHGSIIVHELADDCSLPHAGKSAEIDGCFRVPCPLQNSSILRSEREDVTGSAKLVRTCGDLNRAPDSLRAVCCGDARCHSRCRFDAHRKRGTPLRGIFHDHRREVELIGDRMSECKAYDSSRMADEEGHLLCRHMLCCNHQIP